MPRSRNAPIEVAFGKVLREVRQEKGLSQEGLADSASLHRTYVSEVERGLKSPTLGSMKRLAQALGVDLHALIGAAEGGTSPRR